MDEKKNGLLITEEGESIPLAHKHLDGTDWVIFSILVQCLLLEPNFCEMC